MTVAELRERLKWKTRAVELMRAIDDIRDIVPDDREMASADPASWNGCSTPSGATF